MKKLLFTIIFVLLLSACSSNSSVSSNQSSKEISSTQSPVEVVKNVHEVALKQDLQAFEKLLAYNDRIKGKYKEAMSDIGNMVHRVGGIEGVRFKELKRADIDKDLVKNFDEKYKNGWVVVMADFKDIDDNPFFWVVDKVDGSYYIVFAEQSSLSGVLKEGKEKDYE